ncbi:MAG: DNA ligase [Planctomycetes bacterium]|nr:DNA ligase [Planctomycetota bacterium]
MTDLADGESTQVQGSGSSVYTLKNIGGVYSCTCPAWRNQSSGIESRTCKHLRKLRGDAAEEARLGTPVATAVRKKSADGDEEEGAEAPVLLAESWDGVVDVTDWWISEKLDGVRAYWDGSQFLSRLGNLYSAPAWFTAGLPNEPLDGELWLQRKQFQKTVSIVRRKDQSDHWKQIRFVVFDAPGRKDPFEARIEYLNDVVRQNGPEYAVAHEHARCQGIPHLKSELERVESLGGEGLMLRQPASLYVAGRSSTLLKVKTFYDAEARVVGYQAGAGRHKGRLGALQVMLPDGTEFSVGTGFSDAEREAPPAVGSTITFRYQELSDGGVPRFPSYVGLRKDEPIASAATAPKPAAKKAATPARPKPNTAVPAIPSSPAKSESSRYFEYHDEKSDKYWEITVCDLDVTVRYGKVGTNGQSQVKSFPNTTAVEKHTNKLIEEKTAKGYVEL